MNENNVKSENIIVKEQKKIELKSENNSNIFEKSNKNKKTIIVEINEEGQEIIIENEEDILQKPLYPF